VPAGEREVLAAAMEGSTLADIAAQLDLSEGTVRNHVSVAIQQAGWQRRQDRGRLLADVHALNYAVIPMAIGGPPAITEPSISLWAPSDSCTGAGCSA
jgi:regulatory LuxR family protein